MPDFDITKIINIALILKSGVIILLVLYLFYGLVLIRQIQLMTKVVEVPITPILKIIVLVHFFLSLLLLLLAFTIL